MIVSMLGVGVYHLIEGDHASLPLVPDGGMWWALFGVFL